MDATEKKDQPATEGKFSFESVQDVKTLEQYLRALTEGFAQGRMRFERKDMELTLQPKGLINFVVEAKAKDGRMKLNLKFAWREAVEQNDQEADAFVITPGAEG